MTSNTILIVGVLLVLAGLFSGSYVEHITCRVSWYQFPLMATALMVVACGAILILKWLIEQ